MQHIMDDDPVTEKNLFKFPSVGPPLVVDPSHGTCASISRFALLCLPRAGGESGEISRKNFPYPY